MSINNKVTKPRLINTKEPAIIMLDRGELNNKKIFFKLVKTELAENIGEKVMTLAGQLRIEDMQYGIQQVIEKGIEKGSQKKALEIGERLLASQADMGFIAQYPRLVD